MDKKSIFFSALFSLSLTGMACNNTEPPPEETPQSTAPVEQAAAPPAVFEDVETDKTPTSQTVGRTPSLIPATTPSQQQKIIAQGKTSNPFNLVPDPQRNILIQPNPDYVPPEVKAAAAQQQAKAGGTNGGGGTTGTTGTTANSQGKMGGTTTNPGNGSTLPAPPNIRNGGGAIKPKPFFVPVLPTLPEPELAKQILVSGVVKIGNKTNLIVETPQEGGKSLVQYVKEGDYLGNGQVLVKRIDTNRYTPLIILEQYGIEVSKKVGVSSLNVAVAQAPAPNTPGEITINNVGTIFEPATPLGGVPTNNVVSPTESIPRELTDREIRERSRENLIQQIRNNSLIN
ncbi:MAG: hypothetical protein HC796_07310 [Synechococcaceae cyanobacterium RL_1_2]|nr:hypothetical protein [Synechococcaceae cyanobacterium RL_1_2]